MSGGHYGNNAVQSEGPVSPNSAAAAVAAVAQGIRQQMMAAAGHNISPSSGVDAFALLASSHLPSPADMSPNSSPPDSPLVSNNNVEVSTWSTPNSKLAPPEIQILVIWFGHNYVYYQVC